MHDSRPWIKRHPILSGFLGFFGFLILLSLTDDGRGALIILSLIAIVIWLRARDRDLPKHHKKAFAPTQSKTPVMPSTKWAKTSSTIQSSSSNRLVKNQSHPIETNRTFLAGFDNSIRIGMMNVLQLDEKIHFALEASNGTLIGTDRTIHLIPTGRKAFERRVSLTYSDIQNVGIEPNRNGGLLRFDSGGDSQWLRLSNQSQLDQGLTIAQEIRQFAHMAKITQQESPTPPSESAFVETAHRTVPTASGVKTLSLGDMLAMTPTQFEQLTGKALEAMGYQEMKVSGGAGDLAADLHGKDPQGRSVIVQCKRYAPGNRVGSPSLQQFIGMKAIHHKADRGIYVTTADYSQQAIDLANQHDIVLIDGDDLVKITSLLMASGTSIPTPSVGYKFCTECGARNEVSAKFCAECGTNLAPA